MTNKNPAREPLRPAPKPTRPRSSPSEAGEAEQPDPVTAAVYHLLASYIFLAAAVFLVLWGIDRWDLAVQATRWVAFFFAVTVFAAAILNGIAGGLHVGQAIQRAKGSDE